MEKRVTPQFWVFLSLWQRGIRGDFKIMLVKSLLKIVVISFIAGGYSGMENVQEDESGIRYSSFVSG
jgi:hypothetical protein